MHQTFSKGSKELEGLYSLFQASAEGAGFCQRPAPPRSSGEEQRQEEVILETGAMKWGGAGQDGQLCCRASYTALITARESM